MEHEATVRSLGRRAPASRAALDMLARSEAELVAAGLSGDPADRFLHAHLGALRAAGAVLAVDGGVARRGRPRPAWDRLREAWPELAGWAAYFAGSAPLRAAVESGRALGVEPERADEALAAAEDLHDAVAALLRGARPAAARAS